MHKDIQVNIYSSKDIEAFLQIYEEEAAQDEQSQSLKKLLSVQDKISIFRDIDPEEIKAIVYDLKFVKFVFKDYVIEEGEKKSEIFFIINGECQVFHNKKKIGKLRAGEIFGEAAAIFGTTRNASVVCSTKEATLLSFSIDQDNMEFCASALAILYRNLAFEINAKLAYSNEQFSKK